MKTELEIAKNNIKEMNIFKDDKSLLSIYNSWIDQCGEHKATCQRWLEFLKELEIKMNLVQGDG